MFFIYSVLYGYPFSLVPQPHTTLALGRSRVLENSIEINSVRHTVVTYIREGLPHHTRRTVSAMSLPIGRVFHYRPVSAGVTSL